MPFFGISIEDPDFARESIEASIDYLMETDGYTPEEMREFVERIISDYAFDQRRDGDA